MLRTALEAHLRHAHRIFRFQGTERSLNDHVTTLVTALVRRRPDVEAWEQLSALAMEEHGARANAFLTNVLAQGLKQRSEERQPAVMDALGRFLASLAPTSLIVTLASDGERLARQLALTIFLYLPAPLDSSLIAPLRTLLLDRRLPSKIQLGAVEAVLQTLEPDSPLAVQLFHSLVSGLSPSQAIKRLRQLREQREGAATSQQGSRGLGETFAGILDALIAEQEDRLRMTCPRCQAEFRRPEMIHHLWTEHRLILDDRRVRDPWTAVEEWADEARSDPDQRQEMLRRCRVAGSRIDPEEGLLRVHRLLQERNLTDPVLRQELLELAERHHAARCPACYSLVPVPRPTPLPELNLRPGRLSGMGFEVEIREQGLRPCLMVRTPEQVVFSGLEPGRRWTPRGAVLWLASPLILLALAWSLSSASGFWLLVPVVSLLCLAAMLSLLGALIHLPSASSQDRHLRLAWVMLTPHLHARGFVLADSRFLTGLARLETSVHPSGLASGDPRGDALRVRQDHWPRILQHTERAVRVGIGPPEHLAVVSRLRIEDAHAVGEDPIPLIVDQLARCFEGRFPLAFAAQLLQDWQADWWTPGNLIRLRVLLCDRAFEAGYEVRNLLDAGQTVPSLGDVLNLRDPGGLAALRLLWSHRPSRPWEGCGPVETAFDLASNPTRTRLLERYPDLLLWQEDPKCRMRTARGDGDRPLQVMLRRRGLIVQGTIFTQPPRRTEVINHRPGGVLILGRERFESLDHVERLADRMTRWFSYAFDHFFPNVARVENWQPPDRPGLLRAWGAIPCPECRQSLLPRVGAVGIPLDE